MRSCSCSSWISSTQRISTSCPAVFNAALLKSAVVLYNASSFIQPANRMISACFCDSHSAALPTVSTTSNFTGASFTDARTLPANCSSSAISRICDPAMAHSFLRSIGSVSTTSKRLPFPSSLCTKISPPISSMIFFVIAIPSPVPCTLFVTELSALVNGSKICCTNSSVMP